MACVRPAVGYLRFWQIFRGQRGVRASITYINASQHDAGMVLESILSAAAALRKPWLALIAGFGFASTGIVLSNWVFQEQASLVLVFLTAFAFMPLFIQILLDEEMLGLTLPTEAMALKQHGKAVLSFVMCFIGMSFAFAVFYMAMPAVFDVQAHTIATLSNSVTAHAVTPGLYSVILINNLKVLLFTILFAFIYGAGAIFILSWNASVIGTALGSFVQRGVAAAGGTGMLVAYASAGGMSVVRYFTHGIPEITGYFVGGLAGGILSVALIRHHFDKQTMDRIMLDASDLIIAAIVILVVAAAIETFVTPMLVA
jgi:uncharacterized membrane protein SpoIIM required for sporulation